MPSKLAKFYGKIVIIDESLGKFRERLEQMGLAENTILIFTTDNGTTVGRICQESGYEYYNAGMRGWKSFAWEGGHRVPFFLHWPAGGLGRGRDVPQLTAHFDVLPTLVDLLDLKKPKGPKIDGISIRNLLYGVEDESFPGGQAAQMGSNAKYKDSFLSPSHLLCLPFDSVGSDGVKVETKHSIFLSPPN